MGSKAYVLQLALWLATACGPSSASRGEFRDVCGEPGPFQILELPRGMVLSADYYSTARVDDRIYFVTGAPPPDLASNEMADPDGSTVYSTDPCGEDPRPVAQDVYRVFSDQRWPGVVLGCTIHRFGDLVEVDPAGERDPRPLIERGCAGEFTAHGVVVEQTYDEDVGRATLYPYPPALEDEPDGFVLADDVRHGPPSWGFSRIHDDEAWFLDTSDRVLHVDLADRSSEVELEGVLLFEVTPNGRWMLWQSAEGADGNPDHPSGDVYVRDRATGVDTFIARHSFVSWGVVWDDTHLGLGAEENHADDIHILLPELEIQSLPGGYRVFDVAPDGTWLLHTPGPPFFRSYDPVTETMTVLFEDDGTILRGPDGFWILSGRVPSGGTEQESLYFVPHSGEPRRIAEEVSRRYVVLSEERVVTQRDSHPGGLGRLILTGSSLSDDIELEPQVYAFHQGDGWEDAFGPDTIVYSVSDPERTGVWLARPQ